MKSYFFLLILLFTWTSFGQEQPLLQEALATSVQMSPERVGRIDAMLQAAVKENQVPGVVALIARKGKIIYHKAYGASNAKGNALDKNAIFRIASQTKAITSTAVMMLWEEGKFQLDDPISKYIPEFGPAQILDTYNESNGTYTTKPAKDQITIRHLLSHTSGLGYGVIDGDKRFQEIYKKAGVTDLYTTENTTISESVKKLAKLPLHHNPGAAYVYSEGLDVLAYFVEIISGMPFDMFLRERIFDPLGMNDTWFYLPKDKQDRLVAIQEKKEGKWKDYPVTFYDPDYPKKGAQSFFSGGAGLSSTAQDYATFLQMYLNNGTYNGTRILSRTTIQSIMGNQSGELFGGDAKDYGLAFALVTKYGQDRGGQGSEGTFEWGGYFNTQYFADPKEQIIGILLKQIRDTPGDETGWKFRQMVFAAVAD